MLYVWDELTRFLWGFFLLFFLVSLLNVCFVSTTRIIIQCLYNMHYGLLQFFFNIIFFLLFFLNFTTEFENGKALSIYSLLEVKSIVVRKKMAVILHWKLSVLVLLVLTVHPFFSIHIVLWHFFHRTKIPHCANSITFWPYARDWNRIGMRSYYNCVIVFKVSRSMSSRVIE